MKYFKIRKSSCCDLWCCNVHRHERLANTVTAIVLTNPPVLTPGTTAIASLICRYRSQPAKNAPANHQKFLTSG